MNVRGRKSVGISPLIATLILIAITIVGGILVYTILTGYIGRYSGSDQVSVSSVQLTVAPPVGANAGPGILSISVKDSGSSQVTGLNFTLYNVTASGGNTELALSSVTTPPDQFSQLATSPLSPGLSASVTYYVCVPGASVDPGFACPTGEAAIFVLGGTYDFQLSATFSDGSSYETSGTVVASS